MSGRGLFTSCGATWLRQDCAGPAIARDFLQKSLAQGLFIFCGATWLRQDCARPAIARDFCKNLSRRVYVTHMLVRLPHEQQSTMIRAFLFYRGPPWANTVRYSSKTLTSRVSTHLQDTNPAAAMLLFVKRFKWTLSLLLKR